MHIYMYCLLPEYREAFLSIVLCEQTDKTLIHSKLMCIVGHWNTVVIL